MAEEEERAKGPSARAVAGGRGRRKGPERADEGAWLPANGRGYPQRGRGLALRPCPLRTHSERCGAGGGCVVRSFHFISFRFVSFLFVSFHLVSFPCNF